MNRGTNPALRWGQPVLGPVMLDGAFCCQQPLWSPLEQSRGTGVMCLLLPACKHSPGKAGGRNQPLFTPSLQTSLTRTLCLCHTL